jgi:uncharacterized protein YdeI (YjbR/CyaY-like superfamily)
MDVDLAREMTCHVICDIDTATRASEIFSSKFKGRVLSDEDSAVLQKLVDIAKSTNDEIRVYDVSRMPDKLRALSRGIRKTPAVVVDGEKYAGMDKCLEALGKNY